jgi:hypothetical protein
VIQTYNPILECVELARIRIGTPLRAPAMGSALVLERAVGEPVVIEAGDRVPEARLGNYRRLYRIDVGMRGLSFPVQTPSADAAFPFAVTVRFGCRVIDPVAIARDGVRDMTAALSPSLSAVVREVAAGFDAMRPNDAESAITARLNSALPPLSVELTGFSVSVAMVDTAEIVTARRRIRVGEMKRDAMRPVASGGRDEMLAHVMSIDDGNPMAMIDREREDREADTQAKLEMLRTLVGGAKEGHETEELRKHVVSEFFPGDGTALPGRRGSIRDRIEKRSKAALDSGRVVEGDVPDTAAPQPADTAPPAADARPAQQQRSGLNGKGASRLRGTLGSSRSDDDN